MLATGKLQVSVLKELQIGDELAEMGLHSGQNLSQTTCKETMLRNPCTLYKRLEIKKTRDNNSRCM
jgi:hypothetical protein